MHEIKKLKPEHAEFLRYALKIVDANPKPIFSHNFSLQNWGA